MFSKFSEAIQLLAGNFMLLSALVLTVSIPINLATNYYLYFVLDPDDVVGSMRATLWLEGIFRPIAIGAVIYAVSCIKQGKGVTYGEAIGVGLQSWGRLFAARFVAGLAIGLGCIAFLVPGVILALRWALIEPVVVLEQGGVGVALSRSTDLTKGIRLQIFGLAIFVFIGVMTLSVLAYIPVGMVETLMEPSLPAITIGESVVDSLLDIAYSVLGITLFLFYWEKTQMELGKDPQDPHKMPFGDDPFSEVGLPGKIEDDGNPYRPPQI